MRRPRVWNRVTDDSEKRPYIRVFIEPYAPQEPVAVIQNGRWMRATVQSCTRTTMICDRAYRLKVRAVGSRSTVEYYCDEDGYSDSLVPIREKSGILSPG